MENLLYLGYALIGLGVVLLLADLVLMSFVVAGLGIAALVVGVTLVFANSSDQTTGLVTLIGVFVVVPLIVIGAWRFVSRTSLGKGMILGAAEEDDTFATIPSIQGLEQLRGRFGRTVSALRPAGVTVFDGRRVDTISEGEMIAPGEWVRCIDVQAGRVIVRQVDRPPDLGELDTGSFT